MTLNYSIEKKIPSAIWLSFGPLSLLCSLILLFIKPLSFTTYPLSLMTLIGFVICWQWRLKGLFITASLWLSFILYLHLFSLLETPFWTFSLSISVLLGFAILSLSHNEIDITFEKVHKETNTYLNNLKEQIHRLEETLWSEREQQYSLQLTTNTLNPGVLQAKEQELETKNALINDLQNEILEVKAHQQKLEEALLHKEQELCNQNQLHIDQQIAEQKQTLQQFENELHQKERELAAQTARAHYLQAELLQSKTDKQIVQKLEESVLLKDQQLKSFSNKLDEREQIIDSLKTEHAHLHTKLMTCEAELKDLHANLLEAKTDKHILSQLENASILKDKQLADQQALFQNLQTQLEEKEKQIDILNAQCEELYKEKPADLRRAEGMYLQLKEQFCQKSQELDKARQQLFLTEHQLFLMEKEHEELVEFGISDEIEQFEKQIVQMTHKQIDLENEINQLNQLLDLFLPTCSV